MKKVINNSLNCDNNNAIRSKKYATQPSIVKNTKSTNLNDKVIPKSLTRPIENSMTTNAKLVQHNISSLTKPSILFLKSGLIKDAPLTDYLEDGRLDLSIIII